MVTTKRTKTYITEEKESIVLARLAGPMVTALLGVIVFNLVDTFFVAQLGGIELAALSFTFPVVMVVGGIAHGLGVGITVAVSHAVGEGDGRKQAILVTWGIILAIPAVVAFVTAGFLSMEALFTLLGADNETLKVIEVYMRIWYPGVLVMVVPMAGFAAIRGLGDTGTPSKIILAAILLNTALDPLLIFGIGPFPALGVAGAALATVIARGATLLAVMYILVRREKMICGRQWTASEVFDAWREILIVGIPNSLTRLVIPIGLGIITGMVAVYGSDAVAGFGIATRLEMFALVVVSALVAAMPVFLGQNSGAGRRNRLLRGVRLGNRFCLIYGGGIWLVLWAVSGPVAGLFSNEPGVIDAAVTYMRIVPIAYGFYGMMQLSVMSLNVLKHPLYSVAIPLAQLVVVYLPTAWMASGPFGIPGIFIALAVSYVVAGVIGSRLNFRFLNQPVSA